VTKEVLADWCVNVAKLLMDTPTVGNGPVQGSLGLARIEWSEIEELKT
jgi:hypothetical protein